MHLEKVMEQTHNCVGALSSVACLIDEVIDLARYRFATHSKYCTLSGGQKIDGARLPEDLMDSGPVGPCQKSSVQHCAWSMGLGWKMGEGEKTRSFL